MAKKALLMILDGWGIGKHGKGDVIYNTPTPYLDYLNAISSHSQLQASGEDVGLPDGQMGNSEVGHLNIGAGRIVYQDLVKINRACADGSISTNPQVKEAYEYAKSTGKKLCKTDIEKIIAEIMSRGCLYAYSVSIEVSNKLGMDTNKFKSLLVEIFSFIPMLDLKRLDARGRGI
jgi:bisphosphoglycerate-independent phosphoglycerate mutase (AlkP superfamily)